TNPITARKRRKSGCLRLASAIGFPLSELLHDVPKTPASYGKTDFRAAFFQITQDPIIFSVS
ncbi:MAG: hypothetical protein ACI4PP_05815, partial [Clostridia bacterium]